MNIRKKNNNNSKITTNSKQVEILKKNFPQCFDKDGNFITHKMEEIIGESGLNLSKESYSLNWLGKSYARLLANENPRTLLKEDKKHNIKNQNKESQNLLIEGDNLEVLKHLSNAYAESIKMIYIDPPYNTGSDGFVYNDDRKFKPEELSHLVGIELDEAKRILEFTQSSANSHSAWLTFMYPRLYVARHLLKDDGVIFISIDDNEQAQLKLLCDEIFGEENFIKDLIINTAEGGGNAKFVVNGHETLLVYTKDITKFDNLKRPKDIRGKKIEINDECYWIQEDAIRIEFGKYGNLHYEDILTYKDKSFKNKIDKGLKNNEFILVKKDYGKHIIGKLRKLSDDYSKFHSILNIDRIDKHLTAEGIKELEALFQVEKGHSPFDAPKPLSLLKKIVLSATFNGNQDDIVLDFFAGSGTTAHAVMQLNAEDGGNRKFITVQISEETDKKSEAYKAGYKTIFEITKARIEKAAVKIAEEYPNYKGDLGFKIYETMPVWDGYLDDIEKLKEDTILFDGSKLSDEELETLLTTWKVHDGLKLSYDLQVVELSDYKAYLGEGILCLVYSDFNTDALKALLEKLDSDPTFEPSRIVLFGYNFTSKAQRELDEALNSYANKKSIELDVVVRY